MASALGLGLGLMFGPACGSGSDDGGAPPAPAQSSGTDPLTGWTKLASPVDAELAVVWAASPSDIWIAGADGTLLHGDGASFQPVPLGSTSNLAAIHGSARDDIWVGGSLGALFHFDGSKWTSAPDLAGRGVYVSALGGTSPSDVWAAGRRGGVTLADGSVTPVESFTYHFDGARWTEVVVPPAIRDRARTRHAAHIVSLHAFAPGKAVMVGELGSAYVFDGKTWVSEDSSTDVLLLGVWSTVAGEAWGVGANGIAVHRSAGGVWRTDRRAEGGFFAIEAIAGTDPSHLWAVGHNVRTDLPAAFILEWSGTAWEEESIPALLGVTIWLNGIHVMPGLETWVVGTRGTILRRSTTPP